MLNNGKKKAILILGLPVMAAILLLVWLPVLRWLRLWWPGLPGWLFWPVVTLLTFSTSISYLLPYGRLSSIFHLIGEAAFTPLILFSFLVVTARIIRLIFPGLPLKAAGFAVLFLFLFLTAAGIANAFHIRRKDYRICLDRPCPNLRIALISDIHLGFFSDRKMMKRIAATVERTDPDIVIIAGDLFDDRFEDIRNPEGAAAQFRRLSEKYPLYACEGNHDLFEASSDRDRFISESGIQWMLDESMQFKGYEFIFRRDEREAERMNQWEITELVSRSLPIIAVDHNPGGIGYLWEAGADLVLSGHTHGGQSFPGSLIYKLLPVPSYGMRSNGRQYAVVTSGIGFYGIPIRLGVNSEVAVIYLSGNTNIQTEI